MLKAIRCKNNSRKISQILIGYNLPWILWTLWAMFLAWTLPKGLFTWPCPIHALFGWCPGCGITADYSRLFQGMLPQNGLTWFVLALFLLNALHSLGKALQTQ